MSRPETPYSSVGYKTFWLSMVASILLVVYVSFLHPGVELKEIREQVQKGTPALAQKEIQLTEKSQKEPWMMNDNIAAYGKSIYQKNCAVCHGPTGLGDGPGAAGINPRNLVKGQWKQGGTTMALFKTINKGVPGTSMTAFQHLPVKDRWALVHFIRSITKDKPKDNMAELKAFGPKAQ